jgi:hypothetical protein
MGETQEQQPVPQDREAMNREMSELANMAAENQKQAAIDRADSGGVEPVDQIASLEAQYNRAQSAREAIEEHGEAA